jgi:hypothetical protein
VPGLRENVFRLSYARSSTYEVPKLPWGVQSQGASPPKPTGTLRIQMVPRHEAAAFAGLTPPANGDPALGNRVNGIGVGAQDLGDPETLRVLVQGPHDVLRWLADDIDAVWT